jgi:uncharacterized protein YbaP (TraB family)
MSDIGTGAARRLALLVLVTTLATALAISAPAEAATPLQDCPPVVQPPTATELRAAQREARDRGFLWRLVKDGRSSWLFGTIHVGKLQWAFAGPALARAFAGTDMLALELDPLDPAVARQVAAAMQMPPFADALPAALDERLQRQMAAACLNPALLRGQQPMLQLITLNLLAARHDALDVAFGQDLVLANMAHAAGRRIVSLETVAQQMAALLPDDAAQERGQLEQGLGQLEDGRARTVLRRLAKAWAEGDLATIDNHAEWCDCANTDADRAQLQRLNDARNPHLADAIAALHAQGHHVLAAVGALHMTGPQALPRLLEERGFKVQRVAF